MATLNIDAWIIDGRVRHHRERDHFGSENSLSVALSERIGPYEEQTPVHWVLQDLVDRISRLEAGVVMRDSFTIDAWFVDTRLLMDAMIVATLMDTLTMDAEILPGGRLTMDAWVIPARTLTMDAIIVW